MAGRFATRLRIAASVYHGGACGGAARRSGSVEDGAFRSYDVDIPASASPDAIE